MNGSSAILEKMADEMGNIASPHVLRKVSQEEFEEMESFFEDIPSFNFSGTPDFYYMRIIKKYREGIKVGIEKRSDDENLYVKVFRGRDDHLKIWYDVMKRVYVGEVSQEFPSRENGETDCLVDTLRTLEDVLEDLSRHMESKFGEEDDSYSF